MSILTEEELQTKEDNLKCDLDYNGIKELYEITESHRHLLSANAELSFKNQKLKESLTLIMSVQTSSWYDDANYMREEATKALEELK